MLACAAASASPGTSSQADGVASSFCATAACSACPALTASTRPRSGSADERQVPHGVEDLVADELVLEAQLVVEDARLADHDGVLEAAAEGEAALAQELDLAQEAEGAGRARSPR